MQWSTVEDILPFCVLYFCNRAHLGIKVLQCGMGRKTCEKKEGSGSCSKLSLLWFIGLSATCKDSGLGLSKRQRPVLSRFFLPKKTLLAFQSNVF